MTTPTYDPTNPLPGIYPSVPNEIYHASAGISASMVMDFAELGAYKYNHKRTGPKQPPTRCLVSGTLLHSRSLDKELTLPDWAVMKKYTDFRTNEAKQWRDDMIASGMSIITAGQLENAKAATKALAEHPEARSLLFCKGQSEVSMVAVDPETGIVMRCRPDKLPEKGGIIVDLKTTRDCGPSEFGKDAGKFGYHAKAAYYIDVCALLGVEIKHFVWVAIESDAPESKEPSLEVAVYSLDHDSSEIEAGRIYYKKHLKELALCAKHDKWPMRCEGIQKLQVPYYILKPELDQMAAIPY